MKRCPTCLRAYADETLNFCRADGAYLVADSSPLADAQATLVKLPSIAHEERPTEVFRPDASQGGAGTSSSLTRPLARGGRKRASKSRLIDSLAVLPLENETGEPQAEYLSDGITESIINSLSQLPRLRVVPRATVFRYKGRGVDAREVGRELCVRAVLVGRMIQHGDLLVVSAELIDVEQHAQVWGEQYRHKHEDIFALQERISREITAGLRLRLSGEDKRRLRKRHTENTEAYHLYLKGRFCVNKRTTDWINRGIEHFRQAIDIDPHYALAYAGLADSYALLASSTGERPPADFYPKAEAAARRALELDDTLAEAHTSLGFYRLLYEWDFEGAEREFRRGVEMNPNYANAHDGYSFYFKATAQHERAVGACRQALKVDPLSLFANVSLAWAYYFARQYGAAVEQSSKALELDPQFIFAHWSAGVAYAQQGMLEEATRSLSQSVAHSGGGLTFKSHLGHVHGLAGRTDEARAVLEELEQHARSRYVSAYHFALVHLGLEDHDRTIEHLERAVDERAGFLAFLRVEPMFDPLRADPRFAELERRIGPHQ